MVISERQSIYADEPTSLGSALSRDEHKNGTNVCAAPRGDVDIGDTLCKPLMPLRLLTPVRNMVFFELFLCYFSRFSMLFYPPPLFSLSFTLPRKDKTRAIDLMT